MSLLSVLFMMTQLVRDLHIIYLPLPSKVLTGH